MGPCLCLAGLLPDSRAAGCQVAQLHRQTSTIPGQDTAHLFRELEAPLDAPSLPRSFLVRAVTGLSEAAARAAVHQAAFGPERVSTEVSAHLMRGARHYRPELDVVTVAPEGAFAAMALG